MLEKLKSLLQNDQVFFSIIVVLVGIASFSLGRASVAPSEAKTPIEAKVLPAAVVRTLPVPATTSSPGERPGAQNSVTQLVASKSGTKYHLLTCPGAKQIKEENKIYFDSTLAAEAAGYKRAANCP